MVTDMKKCLLCTLSLLCITFLAGCKAPPQAAAPETVGEVEKEVSKAYGKVPSYFIQNDGQMNPAVKYYVKGPRGTVYLTGAEVVFDFLQERASEEEEEESGEESRHPGREDEKEKSYDRLVFRYKFAGANPDLKLHGEESLPGKINYFVGSQDNWHSNIPTFQKVVCEGIYEGIDARFFFKGANLERTLTLAPGADPGKIVIAYEGIDSLTVKRSGALVVMTSFGGFVQKKPLITQVIGGKEIARKVRYRILDGMSYTYDISRYDTKSPGTIQ